MVLLYHLDEVNLVLDQLSCFLGQKSTGWGAVQLGNFVCDIDQSPESNFSGFPSRPALPRFTHSQINLGENMRVAFRALCFWFFGLHNVFQHTSCVFNQMTPQNIQTANPAPSILYSWQGLVTKKAHSPNNEYQQALFATLVIWVGLFLLEFLERIWKEIKI